MFIIVEVNELREVMKEIIVVEWIKHNCVMCVLDSVQNIGIHPDVKLIFYESKIFGHYSIRQLYVILKPQSENKSISN